MSLSRFKASTPLSGLAWLPAACAPLLFIACGVNGVTTGRVDPPPAVIVQAPAPTPGPTPLPWQVKVTLTGYAGNDSTTAPLKMNSTSRVVPSGSVGSVQTLENGFVISGQTITYTPWVTASLVFPTIETCPINVNTEIYTSGTTTGSASISLTSFSYGHSGYQSISMTSGTPQIMETCGINFRVDADFAMSQ